MHKVCDLIFVAVITGGVAMGGSCVLLNAVQGLHADIHMYHIRGEVQGTRRSKAPKG